MERTHYLYKITCLINQKIYIGQTVEPNKRWNQHRRDSAEPTPSMVIGQAIKKHGAHNFTFEIIATCLGQNNANELETLLVTQYESHVSTDKGYNVSYGGWTAPKSPAWHKSMKEWRESLTDEEKEEMNRKRSIVTFNQINTQGHPSLGKKWSDESKAQLSASLKALDKNLIYTPEVRKNMSEAHLGHKDLEETKIKKSLAQKERWIKQNKERELKEDIRCFAPGCEIMGTGNKYKFINGIRYCNKHGLRMLRYNRLDTVKN